MYDVVIIGAGITGTMTALKLSRYHLRTCVLEKENDIADEATMANSAIVHTGYDPEDGTLKALLNVEGAKQYEKLCSDLGCHYKKVGAFIAACGEEEEKKLTVLKDRGDRRGIVNELLSGDEARKREKNLSDNVTQVLSFPSTAVIYPWEVALACMQTAMRNGTELHLNTCVTAIDKKEDGFIVHTSAGDYETKLIISCAGTHADTIARMVSDEVSYTMKPRKGEYYVLDQDTDFVHTIIFPVPTDKGKGVLAVPTVYGNVLLGPDSNTVTDPEDRENSADGLAYVRANINKAMKNVPFNKVIRTFAGLRPSSTSKDFVITEYGDAPGFIDAASIESPGLASAPAIADYIIDRFVRKETALRVNETAVMKREKPVVLNELSDEERNRMIAANPLYGRIVCRCEQISEGEIVDCIHTLCGAVSIKGVKKRGRPGMGRCQGGFCEPRVAAILARELHISPLDVVLDSPASKILMKENRE